MKERLVRIKDIADKSQELAKQLLEVARPKDEYGTYDDILILILGAGTFYQAIVEFTKSVLPEEEADKVFEIVKSVNQTTSEGIQEMLSRQSSDKKERK